MRYETPALDFLLMVVIHLAYFKGFLAPVLFTNNKRRSFQATQELDAIRRRGRDGYDNLGRLLVILLPVPTTA
jgi:hypothetical protein